MNDEYILKRCLILEHRFQVQISEKAIEDIMESTNGSNDLVIEKLLWETVWQCNDYFPDADFFGMAKPASVSGAIQLINAPDMYFDYVCRKIVLNNVLFEIFTTLGREIHFGRKVQESKYLTLYDDFGYYQMKNLVNDSGKVNREGEANRKMEHFGKEVSNGSLDGRKKIKAESDDFGQWYKRRSNHYTDDVAKSLRESELVKKWKEIPCIAEYLSSFGQKRAGETVYLPLYDCQILSLIYNNRSFLSYINEVLSGRKDDSPVLGFIEDLEKITANAARICPSDINCDEKRLDAVILKYQTEKYFHYELLQIIPQIKKELQEIHSLQHPKLYQSLLNFVYGNIHVGAEYILKYPLQYASNSSIEQRLDNANMEDTAKDEAITIWVERYTKYLGIFSFVTVPVVKMTLEANLYMLARKMPGKQNENLKIKILNLLENYLKGSDDFWNIDYCHMIHRDKFYDGEYLLSKISVSPIDRYEDVHSKYMKIAMQRKWNSYFAKHDWFQLQSCELEKDIQFVQDAVLKWYEPNNYEKIYHPVLDSSYFGGGYGSTSYRKKMIELNLDWILKEHSR